MSASYLHECMRTHTYIYDMVFYIHTYEGVRLRYEDTFLGVC
jgi:hypothetical protein